MHKQGELYLCLQPLPIAPITTRAPPPVRSVAALDAYRSTINLMCCNHPQTIPTPCLLCGKIVFHETGPWCQKDLEPLLSPLNHPFH